MVMVDDYGHEHTLSDVQSNLIQVCLLTEGIGKIALTLKQHFRQFLLKTLFLVLERAGKLLFYFCYCFFSLLVDY